MKPADRKQFVEVVLGFAELKGKALSAPALELYWRAMQDWSLDDFRAAAEQLVRTSEFMPTPKDFEDLRKMGRPTAGEAWLEARACARGWRERESAVCTGNRLIDRAVAAIGGYRAIAMCDLDRIGFLERRFAEHFESMQDAEDVRDAVPQLAYGGEGRISGPRRLLGKSS
jgi:hypothetical protein